MSGKKFIMSIDLGTTGNRVFCFDENCRTISSSYSEFTQHFPRPGWVEHDAVEIWETVVRLMPEAMEKGGLRPEDMITIGITNQRETAVLWDSETGKPLHNAIVWQCRRTAEICNNLKKKNFETIFRTKTGLVVDAYFSGTKIKWMFDNVPRIRELAERGRVRFGTIDSWILWKLTGGNSHVTDYTNASRTLIFDIRLKEWSEELCRILDIPMNILPTVQPSASVFGKTSGCTGIPDGIVIGGIAGDQQAAMTGQNCVNPGTSKNTYGTGCFMLQNNGADFLISGNGLLTTLTPDNSGNPVYALEGSVFIGGAVVQWLRDYMRFFNNAGEIEQMLCCVEEKENEVVFVPAFVGLGAPHWNMDTRGAIFGLTRDTTREEIICAALKSIALQSMDVLDAMEKDTGKRIPELRVDGGAVENSYLMQFQSDILGIPVLVPGMIESTALGAAYLAGLTAGLFRGIDEIAGSNPIVHKYEPVMDEESKTREISLWSRAVKRLL